MAKPTEFSPETLEALRRGEAAPYDGRTAEVYWLRHRLDECEKSLIMLTAESASVRHGADVALYADQGLEAVEEARAALTREEFSAVALALARAIEARTRAAQIRFTPADDARAGAYQRSKGAEGGEAKGAAYRERDLALAQEWVRVLGEHRDWKLEAIADEVANVYNAAEPDPDRHLEPKTIQNIIARLRSKGLFPE